MISICAAIITFNPDIGRLEKSLNAVAPQVGGIVVVDNGSANVEAIREVAIGSRGVSLIENDANQGIARALNEAMRACMDFGFEWVLTLDQDSLCSGEYVHTMACILSAHENVCMLAPTIVDREIGVVGHRPRGECQDVRTCITSGAITSVYAWEAVGGFDEYMFIDSVDFDFCYRIRKAGLRVCQTNAVTLSHRLGESVQRRFLFAKVRVPNYPPFRCYYRARNEIYYPRKYRRYPFVVRGIARNARSALFVVLYEDDKEQKISSIVRGTKDGFRWRFGELYGRGDVGEDAKRKKVTFVLGGTAPVPMGGHKIVYEYANRLCEKGYDVAICFMPTASFARYPGSDSVKCMLRRLLVNRRPTWFSLSDSVRKICIESICDAEVPDGDAIFATEVSTARAVAALSPSKGTKLYLIQGYENWAFADEEVDATYRLGMRNIAISKWLKEIVEAKGGGECVCISNPVDTAVFYIDSDAEREGLSVAVMYNPAPHKGFEYAWKAILESKEIFPGMKVNMFGACSPPSDLPEWVSYVRNATQEQLRVMYSKSAVYVCASIEEGFGLTCLEAMACGCVLVVSDFEGSREYAIDGWNALVSPVKDSASMCENIVHALSDSDLRSMLSGHGLETATARDWSQAVDSLVEEIERS